MTAAQERLDLKRKAAETLEPEDSKRANSNTDAAGADEMAGAAGSSPAVLHHSSFTAERK